MLDRLFWNIFKKSGDIDAYIAYREFLELENRISPNIKKENINV